MSYLHDITSERVDAKDHDCDARPAKPATTYASQRVSERRLSEAVVHDGWVVVVMVVA